MNGRPGAHTPSTTARPDSRQVCRDGEAIFSLRTCHHHAQHNDTAIRRPERCRPKKLRNRYAADHAKDHNPMLGGMTGPMMPADAISPPDIALSPALVIIGMRSRKCHGVRHRRARQGGQDACGHDGDITEPAFDVPDEGECHVDDPARQATCVHDLACEHEEWNRHKRKTVGPVDDVLRDYLRVKNVELIHQSDAADDQRECDRHAECHGAQQRQREHRDCHAAAPYNSSDSRTATRSSSPAVPISTRKRS